MRLHVIVKLLLFTVLSLVPALAKDAVEWVDPFIGTGRADPPVDRGVPARWSRLKPTQGNLHPGPTSPFGFVSVVPYGAGYPTGYWRGPGGRPCSGFTHFQQSGTGAIRSYYNFFLVSPIRGELTFEKPAYVLTDECASPGLYRANISSAQTTVAVTVSRRTALHRYQFEGAAPSHVVVDLAQGYDGPLANKVSRPTEASFRLSASDAAEGEVVIAGVPLHFCLKIHGAVAAAGAWAGTTKLAGAGPFGNAPGPFGIWFTLAPGTRTAEVKIAFSLRSISQARATLAEEIPSWDFDAEAASAKRNWQSLLGRFRVEGGTAEEKTLFYTALYRALIKPDNASDENPFWNSSLPWYVDFATLWDTYKTQMPLIMTFYPKRGGSIANALLNIAQHQGSFPVAYLLPNKMAFDEQGVDFAQMILADAHAKRVPGINWREALPVLVRDLKSSGHYADTALQYSYASACLVPIAHEVGDRAIERRLRRQAASWPAALNATTHKLPPRKGAPGGRSFYEGGVWNYSLAVWHDMPRLIGLYGSRSTYVSELDRFFGFAPTRGVDLPFEGLNNESDMETPYAYIFAGRPDRTQELMSLIRHNRFAATRRGWPGNDDSGGIAAWYVWSAIGLYPLVGQDLFLIASPMFPCVSFEIAGSRFSITAEEVSTDAHFVQSAELDGRPIDRAWLRYDELRRGGQLTLHMGRQPSRWGAMHPPWSDLVNQSEDPKSP